MNFIKVIFRNSSRFFLQPKLHDLIGIHRSLETLHILPPLLNRTLRLDDFWAAGQRSHLAIYFALLMMKKKTYTLTLS